MISDNFRLDYQNDLKFSQSHPVGKSNVSSFNPLEIPALCYAHNR